MADPVEELRRRASVYGKRAHCNGQPTGDGGHVRSDYGGSKAPVEEDGNPQDAAADGQGRKPTQAEQLLGFLHDSGAELWHTPAEDPYVSLSVGEHYEHLPVRSRGMRDWLRHAFYKAHERAPGSQAVQDAVETLAAQAQYDGEEYDVYVRVAHHDGAVYLDLADAAWQAVEVTTTGWRIVTNPKVRFCRRRGMLPLPAPVADGDLAELRDYLAAADEPAWVLSVAWLLATLSRGPYPVLALRGEQGSGKTTVARVLRGIVDPSLAPMRAPPREERDLIIAARNGWIVGLDNLSSIPAWESDALCRLSTGGGWATRELYTDTDEIIIDVTRPIVLTGIEDVVTRDDLADRALVLDLPAMSDSSRREEVELWAAYAGARPRILGALLDAVSCALRRRAEVRLPYLPRMADFAVWVVSAEPALPWAAGRFLEVYGAAREEAAAAAVESDTVAQAVRDLMMAEKTWEGTAQELLAVLGKQVGEDIARSRHWPKSPRALSGRLRRSAPALRHVGVEVEPPSRSGRQGRQWQLRRSQNTSTDDRHHRHHRHRPKESADDGGDCCTPDGDGDDGRMHTRSNVDVEGEL